jgi:hypothetical protein
LIVAYARIKNRNLIAHNGRYEVRVDRILRMPEPSFVFDHVNAALFQQRPQIRKRLKLGRAVVDDNIKRPVVVVFQNVVDDVVVVVVVVVDDIVVVVVVVDDIVVVVDIIVDFVKLIDEKGNAGCLRRITQKRLDAMFVLNLRDGLHADAHNATLGEKITPSAQRRDHGADLQQGQRLETQALKQDVVQGSVPVAILVGTVTIEQIGEIRRRHFVLVLSYVVFLSLFFLCKSRACWK